MSYTSRQAAQESQRVESGANKVVSPKFTDQRASTSVQLKQQQMMGAAGNNPLQRMEDEELLQGKFATVQRAEEEELLQGKFETAQLAEEEELLQGKFSTAQLMEEEEPLQGKFETAQLMDEEEPLQGKFETAQLAEDEELLQGKFSNTATAQLEEKPNNTGLPNQLKAGIESLSGMSMDGVKVHYNSDKPAQLNAHAYAQGTDIHVAPGQEQHLPHEAWHVVQQAQGRVKPTTQMKGTSVNDDVGLETEADVMGAKAIQMKSDNASPALTKISSSSCVQAMMWTYIDGAWYADDETTNPTPTKEGKNGERFDDGLDAAEDVVEAPVGYENVSLYGTTVWLKSDYALDQVARSHLIQGANGTHGDGGWHGFGSKMKGSYGDGDAYLHPSKSDPTLYLLKNHGKHTDGNVKVEIVKLGAVSGGFHTF